MRTWNSVSSPQLHPLYDLFCRDVLELKEAIRIKEAEGDAYISEIEVSSFLVFLSAVFVCLCVRVCLKANDAVTADNWSSI